MTKTNPSTQQMRAEGSMRETHEPLRLAWERHPSVTTGGKAYFYLARISDGRWARVVWNRRVLAYAARLDDARYSGGRLLGFFLSASRAQRHCERVVVEVLG